MKIVIVGLGNGDETKGSIVDFLSAHFDINYVVRYNGGCQAAHNVYSGLIHHIFSQFGSGTLNNTKTILSKYMLIEPIRLLNEADVLIQKGFDDVLSQLYISENCVITTPVHRLIGCLKELSRKKPNGSVGLGIGETIADYQKGMALKIKDLLDPKQATFLLNGIWATKIDLAEQLIDSNPDNQAMKEFLENFNQTKNVKNTIGIYLELINKVSDHILTDQAISDLINQNDVIFEGAQGTLLDPNYGFFPHVTKTICTTQNAKDLIQNQSSHSIGLIRAYGTRHGLGPFPTEADLGISEENNTFNQWQKDFRLGWLDLVMLRYALSVQKIDSIGLTCVDKLNYLDQIKVCTHYCYQGQDLESAHNCFDFDSDHPENLLNLKIQHPKSEILAVLADCIPIYQIFPSWKELSVLKADDLPSELSEYINFIEEQSVPISLISYGPDRKQKLFLKEEIITHPTPS